MQHRKLGLTICLNIFTGHSDSILQNSIIYQYRPERPEIIWMFMITNLSNNVKIWKRKCLLQFI